MKTITSILFFLFCIITEQIPAQDLEYNITANKNQLGTILVKQTEKNGIIQIQATSEVKVQLFVNINLKYILNCTYKNNQLLYSSVTTYVNGKLHSTSTTEKKEGYYEVIKDGHSSRLYENIKYSGALLYHTEPIGKTKLYSEFNGIEKPIKKIDAHTYQITNPDNGHISIYKYKNGILESTTIEHALLTFTLTKK